MAKRKRSKRRNRRGGFTPRIRRNTGSSMFFDFSAYRSISDMWGPYPR